MSAGLCECFLWQSTNARTYSNYDLHIKTTECLSLKDNIILQLAALAKTTEIGGHLYPSMFIPEIIMCLFN